MIDINRHTGCGGRRTIRAGIRTALGVAALATVLAATAQAQCVGDCDNTNSVAVNELVRGVNISLGSVALSTCPSFDANDSGGVEVNELVRAVNNALEACPPPGETPTATATSQTPSPETPTPTPTATTVTGCPTNTPVVAEGCGDGFVDLERGETCDDGNTVEGDDCPGNCRRATCTPSDTTFSVRFDFDTIPPDVLIQGLQLFVRYPESVISIPGMASQDPVSESVTSELYSALPFDRDYGVTVNLTDQSFVGYESGTAATIVFDLCEGAAAPTACDLTCVVNSAVDANFSDVPVDQVPCTIAVVP